MMPVAAGKNSANMVSATGAVRVGGRQIVGESLEGKKRAGARAQNDTSAAARISQDQVLDPDRPAGTDEHCYKHGRVRDRGDQL